MCRTFAPSLNIREIKSRRVRCAGHFLPTGRMSNGYKML